MNREYETFVSHLSNRVRIATVPDFSVKNVPHLSDMERFYLYSASCLGFYRHIDKEIYLLDPAHPAVVLHELVHWARHKHLAERRTDLDVIFEELIAHTGARILSHHLNIPRHEISIRFEEDWANALDRYLKNGLEREMAWQAILYQAHDAVQILLQTAFVESQKDIQEAI